MRTGVLLWLSLWYGICDGSWLPNNPYPAKDASEKIFYTSFVEQPKTLDPAKSYSLNEYLFNLQIYEPLLQYDYLIRPYQLVPQTAQRMPEVQYFDDKGQELVNPLAGHVALSVYIIHIQPGIQYQPHPAFARKPNGQYRYFPISGNFLENRHIHDLADFKYVDTRKLTADDYIYQIKRLATPAVNSPIYGLMSDYILGFREFGESLPHQDYNDLRNYSLSGVKKIDDETYQIVIKGLYPEFLFWLAMPFFSPIPWEADKFYAQPGMVERNLGFGWYPVGTGPFYLAENNPNSRMMLVKNPNYHEDYFPSTGSQADREQGYLRHANERLPMIDKAIYTLEKESIPRWIKFLQGYYDTSGISTDSFDKAIQITGTGVAALTDDMKAQGMRLTKLTEPSVLYLGFNMLDNVVGKESERARKLRQAISIAVNYDEYLAIFLNGRGKPAFGPIPPGVFGYREGAKGINPYVFRWDGQGPQRYGIARARALMNEAGYPGGRDPKTGEPLLLHYDITSRGGPDDKAQLTWMQKQFARLGISLDIRATQYNRFQEKLRTGNIQMFSLLWRGDYPDPENFLSLFYGPNSKVAFGGVNEANYQNPLFDKLFDEMKNRSNDPTRQQLIDEMLELLRRDAPWSFGIYTETMLISQGWLTPYKTNVLSADQLKYVAIDVSLRNQLRALWNRPIIWPVAIFLLFLLLCLLPFVLMYRHKDLQKAQRVIQ